ncbi:MAG: hypothetical protein MUD08_08270 [Cytophagales bacterium]|nr:hypothetical protein [Cytophagales bacterium]
MADAVYHIHVCQHHTRLDCPCRDRPVCERGFFSVLLAVLYGIAYARGRKQAFYIDMRSRQYAYSQPSMFGGNSNFLEYFFRQPLSGADVDRVPSVFCNAQQTYPYRVWHRNYFKRLHQTLHDGLPFHPAIARYLDEETVRLFGGNRVLGVHLRGTDHSSEVKPVHWETWEKLIRKELPAYDRLFIATDDARLLQKAVDAFGIEKTLFNTTIRSADGARLHRPTGNGSIPYQLGLEALLDCYCLSRCQQVMLCESNLSYAACVFNPALNYRLVTAWDNNRIASVVGKLYHIYLTYRIRLHRLLGEHRPH